jgi:DNA-binding NarL/FixJ family response regulator
VSTKIKVLLVEDHYMARVALRSILSDKTDVSIIAETDNGGEAIELYGKAPARRHGDGFGAARYGRV